jgi:hypothetical protein
MESEVIGVLLLTDEDPVLVGVLGVVVVFWPTQVESVEPRTVIGAE